jgi:hypothetical protein
MGVSGQGGLFLVLLDFRKASSGEIDSSEFAISQFC